MWGELEGVFSAVHFTGLDLGDLLADGDERIGKAVELFSGFGLGGLNHDGAADRPGDGGGVKAVIHEPLGYIIHLNPGGGLERPKIHDEFMGDPAAGATEEDRVVGGEFLGQIVSVQEGHLGATGEATGPDHGQIHPGNDQNTGAPLWGGSNGAHMAGGNLFKRVGGKERGEVLGNGDGANPGTAAAVRDAEGLVKVEVTSIGTEIARAADADEGVEVGAIEIDLAASLVDLFAKVTNASFENTVGGGIGDHGRGDAGAVFLNLGVEVGEVDVAGGIAGHGDDAEAGEDGGGRIGPVGGDGDEADVALGLAAGELPAADSKEAGVFALGAGVGLEGDVRQAGDLAEPVLEVGDHAGVAGGLIGRGEGVGIRDGGPAERGELGGSIELHGAGAEWNHGVGGGEILGGETADVAEQLVLVAVGGKDGVFEGRGRADQRAGKFGCRRRRSRGDGSE